MDGCKFLGTVVDGIQCVFLLTTIVLYRLILFLIFFAASAGPALLACYLWVYLTKKDPYPECWPCLTVTIIGIWAKYSLGIESRIFGQFLERLKREFPGTMSCGRFTVHVGLYASAFTALYLEFENVNTIPEFGRSPFGFYNRIFPVGETFRSEKKEVTAVEEEPWHVTIFLFALSYLVFVTSRNLQKDMYLVVRNLPSVTFSVFNNWLLRISFAIIHTLVNLIYFMPCLIIAYATTIYRTSGLALYFQTNFIAGMAGMVVALLELNRPWPQMRARLPFLFYENNAYGKKLLAHVLVIGIILLFYQYPHHKKISLTKFDSANMNVTAYCLLVAFTTLHLVKLGVNAILTVANEYDQRIEEINNAILDVPEFADSRATLHRHSNHQHATAEDRENCTDCLENAIANNNNNDDDIANRNRSKNSSKNASAENIPEYVDCIAKMAELSRNDNAQDERTANSSENLKPTYSGVMRCESVVADIKCAHLQLDEKDANKMSESG